jgi:hypothetical protein
VTVILTGWYEKECGAIVLDETGESLSDIVARLIKRDPEDFGHTDMELELHLPSGEIRLVEDQVESMVKDEYI